MKVLKNDLYAFVDEKVTKERASIIKQKNLLEDDTRKVIENAVNAHWKTIGDRLSKIYDDYEVFLENIHKSKDYSYTNKLSNLNYAMNSKNQAVSDILHATMKYVQGDKLSVGYGLLFSDTDVKVIDLIKTKYEPLQKKHTDLDTLQIELNAVIKASSSGKQAYNAMVALGVNMDSLVSAESQLPAVQKLSVDVCAINGGC